MPSTNNNPHAPSPNLSQSHVQAQMQRQPQFHQVMTAPSKVQRMNTYDRSRSVAQPRFDLRALASPKNERNLLEHMPKWLICVPLTLQWLYLAVRFRGLTLPTAVNPHITAGGLVGEGKSEYFNGMGEWARSFVAPYVLISSRKLMPSWRLIALMAEHGLRFPVIAKPELGLCGYGVRLITTVTELQSYRAAFPSDQRIMLQQYLPQEGEAGIFYERDPKTGKGTISGLALRFYPRVTGDGVHTIGELIEADPRAKRVLHSKHHEARAGIRVPAKGEVVRLATIGSTRVGGVYRDGKDYITASLTEQIDSIARDMPAFYFGRFDVRFSSLQDLCEGRRLTIMEINGAGSEAIQAWDPDLHWSEGLKMIFKKQYRLFEIAAVLRDRGAKPIKLMELARLNSLQQKLIGLYPPSN
jgi:hypothetical protein